MGVKLFAQGVMVTELSEGKTAARSAGLKAGDVILAVNGTAVESTEQLAELLRRLGAGNDLTLTVRRGAKELALNTALKADKDGVCRLGAWVRDSMAGIGTMSFYDPETETFAGLGHGISDMDTGELMPLAHGAVMKAAVKAVNRGACGSPGELRGDFDLLHDFGTLCANTDCGIFGKVIDPAVKASFGTAVPVASAGEIRPGKAAILANVAGEEVREYAIEIERVSGGDVPARNMLLRVTDPALLAATGGIVQGMSGSPILQDGRLVGAVTHVLIDDPTRGYGIFAENMLAAAG